MIPNAWSGFDFGLGSDADMLRKTVADFARDRIASRARAYLQANCAYCHSDGGEARTTGLDLGYDETGSMQLGICNMPIAAGKAGEGQSYDIVPQRPESSILVYRMESTAPAIAMPEIGRSLEHFEAVELISDWINLMPATNCQ